MSWSAIPKISKAECTAKGIKVTWEKVNGAAGYVLERSTDGKTFSEVAEVDAASGTTYSDNKAKKNGSCYYYRVYAFDDLDGEKYTGYASPVKSTYRLSRSTVKSVKNVRKGTFRYWKRVLTMTGYQEV